MGVMADDRATLAAAERFASRYFEDRTSANPLLMRRPCADDEPSRQSSNAWASAP
jgi:hypothetical protein